MRFLKQQAQRSKNPKVEHRKIDQALDLAAKKIINRSEYRKKGSLSIQLPSPRTQLECDIKLLKVLKIPDIV
jgi:hypothetical protein